MEGFKLQDQRYSSMQGLPLDHLGELCLFSFFFQERSASSAFLGGRCRLVILFAVAVALRFAS